METWLADASDMTCSLDDVPGPVDVVFCTPSTANQWAETQMEAKFMNYRIV